MKSIIAITIVQAVIMSIVYSQPRPSSNYQPSFAAVIVKNLDTSAEWYKSIFDLNLKERMGDEKTDYKIVILESPVFTIELMELRGSLPAKEVLAGKPGGTRIQGHSKIGFHLTDMNAWLRHLEKLNVSVPHIWTDSQTGKRNFLITDPDGNLIQFFE